MPKYLFTSDQRISKLPKRIKWVADYIQAGHDVSEIIDKSDNNNATTLKFYYNLHSGTETCRRASSDPLYVIHNFVLKFQFPNTRTRESLNDSLSEEMLFAPFRSITTILHLMASQNRSGSSKITLSEILYFLFCNPKVYKGVQVDYEEVVSDLLAARQSGKDLKSLIKIKLEWNQYERQCREMVKILPYASPRFKYKTDTLFYSTQENFLEDEADRHLIQNLISYNDFWYPTNKENFKLSNLEYASYMDTQNTPFQVIRPNSNPNDFVPKYPNKPFHSLQRIFYGAPGTGKSNTIKKTVDEKKKINYRVTFHPDSDYSTFVGCYKPAMKVNVITKNDVSTEEEQIVYRFVPQAFTKAYTAAWKTTEDVYLIIEEINRGNCAQIFGDLFQLLDRGDDGFSEYPVDADSDLADYICKALADSTRDDFRDGVKEGTKLVLPNNLYIWATMNTSDQSLFPIDSAFKRRWDWEYIPITNANKGWLIEADGKRYDWWEFLEKMNDKIGSTTNSEDKKLGYFFCKSKDGIIDAGTFVGKVVFYVWNDVFKDFAEESGDLFGDTDGSLLSFNKFYTVEGGMTKVVESKVALLLQNLGMEPIGEAEEDEEVVDDEENDVAAKEGKKQRKESLISIQIPNQPIIRSAESTQYKAFAKALSLIGIDKIIPLLGSLKYKRLECPVLSTEKYPAIENNTQGYSYFQEGELFIVKGCKSYTYIRILEDLNDLLKIGLTLETK